MTTKTNRNKIRVMKKVSPVITNSGNINTQQENDEVNKNTVFGIDLTYWPSVFETMRAEKTFISTYQEKIQYVSQETAIREALIAVWVEGRKYQHERKEVKQV